MLKAFDEGRIYGHVQAGEGPLCVLLHGWARDSSDLAPLGSMLEARGLPTLRLDLPGFGASPSPDSAWATPEYAESVKRVLDEVGGIGGETAVVVVGHSFGGRVALHLSAMLPPPVSAAVVTGVPLFRPQAGSNPPLSYRVVRWAARRGLVGQARLEAMRRRYGSSDYQRATGVMRDIFVKVVNEDYAEQLAAIRIPLWLVWGSADTAAPVEQARRAAAMVPGAHLTVLDGQDHFGPVATPAALASAVDAAVARLRSSETEEKG